MTYLSLIEQYQKELAIQTKSFEKIAMLRLITFLLTALSLGMIYLYNFHTGGWVFFSITIIAFILLVFLHNKANKKIQRLQILIQINEDSEKRRNNEWIEFNDDGSEYINTEHPFSRDLDIFGKASLFQWINVTNTNAGRLKLKETLENPYKNFDKLQSLQEAIKELAEKVLWRQEFQLLGLWKYKKNKKEIPIQNLLGDGKETFTNPFLLMYFKISPLILILSLILYSFHPIAKISTIIFIIIHISILLFYKNRFMEVFKSAGKFKNIIRQFSNLIHCSESEIFQSNYLIKLQKSFLNEQNEKASVQIKKLQKILELIDIRQSFIHSVVNLLSLWDVHCLIQLEKWRVQSGSHLENWLKTIAELETLSSLAIIQFDNPDWAEPVFLETGQREIFLAENIAHPLISSNTRVANDFKISEIGEIAIFTGSNMSGKSTFLRTVGINLLLAYLGLPVCAEKLQCTKMKIFTSMRITDNLDKHISSFFAELLRIKQIIDLSNHDELTLFLIDEIFRGTNSRDRITGAKEILKKLSLSKTVGLVTTHDLELTDLVNNDKLKIKNYHFMEEYEEGKIHFDYKLKPDITTTSNALYLMKMVGIDIQEN